LGILCITIKSGKFFEIETLANACCPEILGDSAWKTGFS
jgi:hypothetical protein